MKIQRGRPGRSAWSRALSCHHVDRWYTHGGRYPTKNLDVRPKAGCQSVREATIDAVVHNAGDGSTQNITVGHRPHVSTLCLPNIIACDQISQAFRRCISILQNTGGENGLGMHAHMINSLSDMKSAHCEVGLEPGT